MKNFKLLPVVLVTTLLLVSCEKKDENTPGKYTNGVFIINEGAFGNNNGSISFFRSDSLLVDQNIFFTENNRPLGDVVQSMSIKNDKGFIVVNGSGKLEIVDLESFKLLTDPLFFSYPRYFLPLDNDLGYLSNGSLEGKLYVINTISFDIVDSIEVGKGPETMVKLNDLVYVANSGGWDRDSTISIINTATHEETKKITVGDIPIELESDADNNIWVHCKGYAQYSWEEPYDLISETDAYLVKINTTNNEIDFKQKIGKGSDFAFTPIKMAVSIDGNTIYFMKPDGIYAIDKDGTSLPAEPLIEGNFNGLEVNPESGEIYVFEANYTGSGLFKIYTANGDSSATYEVGIGPNGACFYLD